MLTCHLGQPRAKNVPGESVVCAMCGRDTEALAACWYALEAAEVLFPAIALVNTE